MRRWMLPVAAALVAVLLVGYLSSRRVERVEETAILMDTVVRVVAYGPRERAEEAVAAALAEMGRLEELWHPDRPGSDVARVNQAAGQAPVQVAPETLELTELALQVAAESGGALDPTVGPLVRLWGFGHEPQVPTAAARAEAMLRVNWQRLRVDRAAGTLFLEEPGMALELGAVAKGYAAQQAREVLRHRGIAAGLVQAGGCVATLGRRPDGRSWEIAVQHPRSEEAFLTVFPMGEGFADTAGDYQRYFLHEGVRYHHIMDPETGEPARGLVAVTVLAPEGARADALATAALVLGPEAGYRFLAAQPGVEAFLVTEDGRVQATPGFPGDLPEEVHPWP